MRGLNATPYIDGYIAGQHDALTWLGGEAPEDHTLAAFDFRVQMRAALVCLARNLRIAAALERAFRIATANHCFVGLEGFPWWGGCGRAAP